MIALYKSISSSYREWNSIASSATWWCFLLSLRLLDAGQSCKSVRSRILQDNNSSRIHGQADDCDTDSENMANDQREIEKEDFDESSFDLESLDVRKTIGTGRWMND